MANVISIDNHGNGREDALKEVEQFAAEKHLSRKEALKARLLTEEVLGMVEGISGQFTSSFWITGDEQSYCIHLDTETKMNVWKRDEFLDVSSSGKNASAKGILGKIRDIFEIGLLGGEYAGDMSQPGLAPYYAMGSVPDDTDAFWSLNNYRKNVGDRRAEDAGDAWDELEKSVIALVAEDVQVGIRGNKVYLAASRKCE